MYKYLIFTLILSNINVYAERFWDVNFKIVDKQQVKMKSCRKDNGKKVGYNNMFIDTPGGYPTLQPVFSIDSRATKSSDIRDPNIFKCINLSYESKVFTINITKPNNGQNDYIFQLGRMEMEKEHNLRKDKELEGLVSIYKELLKKNNTEKNNIVLTKDKIKLTILDIKTKLATVEELKDEIKKLEGSIGYTSTTYYTKELRKTNSDVLGKNADITNIEGEIDRKRKEIELRGNHTSNRIVSTVVTSVNGKLKTDFNIYTYLDLWVKANMNDIRSEKIKDKTLIDFDYMEKSFIEINEKR